MIRPYTYSTHPTSFRGGCDMHACPSSATLQLQCGAISLNCNADNCNLPAAIVLSTSFHIVINILSKMPTIPQRPANFLGVSTSSEARFFKASVPEIILKCNHQLMAIIISEYVENNYFGLIMIVISYCMYFSNTE